MSSFYEDASLVMIPSGYKTSKVYSAKPTDGAGDLVFTRSNDTATRVGPDGLIEKVRTNVLLYSNTFSSWTAVNATATSGQTAYDGTSNAWVLKGNTTNGRHQLWRSNATTGEHTISIYAKASGHSFLQLASANTVNQYANFNLTDGTVGTVGSDFSNGQITSIGSGWYRISVISKNLTNDIYLSLVSSNTAGWLESWAMPNNTDGVLIMDGQLEAGVLTPFIGNTTTAAVSVGPVANVPRLDYLGSSCPRLLLEPQRTNIITFSEQIDNAAWTKTNTTITANALTSPDGYQNADVLVENSTSNAVYAVHRASRPTGLTLTTSYSVSFFAKKVTRDFCYYQDFNFFQSPVVFVFFNLATGTIGTASGGVLNPKMENYGNGWYRCSFQFVASGAAGASIDYRIGSATADNIFTYTGVIGQQAISLTACQFETGTYITSYIPTLGASVTRGVDAASKTGISSLIGQTEGTLFLEMSPIASTTSYTERVLRITGGTDEVGIQRYGDNRIVVFGISGGVTSWSVDVANIFSAGQVEKIAVGYKLNDVAVYVNGVQIGTDTSAAMFTSLADLFFANDASGNLLCPQNVKQALLFKTRLTNDALAALTSL